MNSRIAAAARTVAVLAALATAAPATAAQLTFAVFGDTPYDDAHPGMETQSYLDMLQEIGRSDARFVVHIGDFKHGSTPCSDELFEQRRAEFDMSVQPFIFVFGDNDWTDCWRTGSHPPARLDKLRSLFAAGDSSLGRSRIALARQSSNAAYASYRENVRWADGNILFVGLNVPGSNNNYTRMPEEYRARNAANLAWLADAFELARAQAPGAIILFMQADPFLPRTRPNGYTELLDALRSHVAGFAGLVALVHGDSHACRVDYPLWDSVNLRYFANFRRIETFGSPRVNWLRLTLDTGPGTPDLTVAPGRLGAACCRRELGAEPCS
jgi:hypothetical protein